MTCPRLLSQDVGELGMSFLPMLRSSPLHETVSCIEPEAQDFEMTSKRALVATLISRQLRIYYMFSTYNRGLRGVK